MTDPNAKSVRASREVKLAKYREERDNLNKELANLTNRRRKIQKRIRDVSNAIYDLLHESAEVPSVTDHAVIRYLERVEGVDIQELRAKVANHKQAQRVDNVIVTVNAESNP